MNSWLIRNLRTSPRSCSHELRQVEDTGDEAAEHGDAFEEYARALDREAFLVEMDHIVPWKELCAYIAPYYPKAGDGHPYGDAQGRVAHRAARRISSSALEVCATALNFSKVTDAFGRWLVAPLVYVGDMSMLTERMASGSP